MSAPLLHTPLAALETAVIDTETTGLDARTARVVEIAAFRMVGGEITREAILDRRVNPGIPIPAETTAVHGISDLDVAHLPRMGASAGEIAAPLEGKVIVGHTIGYDLMVLARELRGAGATWHDPVALDVRLLAEVAIPSLAQYDLERIASVLQVKIEHRHSARGDAGATAQIYAALLPILRERGIRTLGEALMACRALADRQASAGRVPLLPAAAAPGREEVAQRLDAFAYRHRISDVMSAPPQWIAGSAKVSEAIALLIDRKLSSVLVAGTGGVAGIVTERDILRAVAGESAASLARPVESYMSHPLLTVAAGELLYRAIGRIERLGIRHLAVTGESGAIVGVVTTRNLLRNRATTAIMLGDGIEAAGRVEDLAGAWAALTPAVRSLIEDGVEARTVAGVISAEVCALTRRAAMLAEARMAESGKGAPPVPYAVLVLGSAGRGESLLAADQDNAIVYAEGETGGPADLWLGEMATHMCAILDAVGVPFCKGGVMAKNALWRRSVAGWQAMTDSWVGRLRPEDLLNVDIFFDAAVVHGDPALGEAVLADAFSKAKAARDLQMHLSLLAARWRAPVGLLGGFKTEANGRLDLKKSGLLPVFTAARILALRFGLRMRDTPGRLRGALAAGVGNEADTEILIGAHGVIMEAMLRQQIADGAAGIPLSPRVDVKHLNAEEKGRLKQALGQIGIAPALINEGRI